MFEPVTLKEIERRAFVTFQKDGIWALCLGLVLMGFFMIIFALRVGISEGLTFVGYMTVTVCIFAVALLLRKKITTSRIGYAEFGPERKTKWKLLWVSLTTWLVTSSIIYLFVIRNFPDYVNGVPQYSTLHVIISQAYVFANIQILGSLFGYFLEYPRAHWMGFIFGVLFIINIRYLSPYGLLFTIYTRYLSSYGLITTLVELTFLTGFALIVFGVVDFVTFLIRNPRPIRQNGND